MFYIARKRFYYGKENAKYSIGQHPEVYKSRADALEALAAEESSVYYLGHNESGRPALKVVSEDQLTKGILMEAGL
jgi:hypothetical protein